MNSYSVKKVQNPHPLDIEVPGSKSITNRALLIAALAEGTSILRGVLFCEDSYNLMNALRELGFPILADEKKKTVSITGFGGKIPSAQRGEPLHVHVGNAGTAARFLTASLGLTTGTYQMDASEQMRKRPMAELLDALENLGVEISYIEREGHFPFRMENHGIHKDEVEIDIDKSSQFLSALMISSVLLAKDFTIHVRGTHGMDYVRMTIRMMQDFGVTVEQRSPDIFWISGDACYRAKDYRIEPDVSSACYFYAMSPLLHVPVRVRSIHTGSMQGDLQFLTVLEQMGCKKKDTEDGIKMLPGERFQGGTFDLSSFSDQALTLAAIAPFAEKPVTITGIGHIRHQECDRMRAIEENLTALGIAWESTENSICIAPGTIRPAQIQTFADHRVAMAFTLPGLALGGIVILNPDCCKKTFAEYFRILDEKFHET